jgi:hypothetical protein
MMMKNILFITGLLLAMVSCNKTKTVSNRLDGQKWRVTELSVDGVNQSELPLFKFSECEIYKESCKGLWYLGEEGHSGFAWQIRDKGKILEFNNQADHAHGLEDVKAAEQCIAFSGVYKIIKSKRKSMECETSNAFGYAGKKVVLKMERKD